LSYNFRIDFSTDNVSTSLWLPGHKNQMQVASSNNHGYLMSGLGSNASGDNTYAYLTGIDKVDFITTITESLPTSIPFARARGGCVSNTEDAYLSGGADPEPAPFATSNRRFISKFNFSTDTSSDTSMKLRDTCYDYSSGVSDGIYGYFVGGRENPDSGTLIADHSTVSKLDFSSETTSNLSNLPEKIAGSRVVQNNLYGFFMANKGPTGSSNPDTWKIDFATGNMIDTGVTTFPTNDQVLYPGAAVSGNYNGYIAGGSDPETRDVYKFDYITSTKNDLPNALPTYSQRAG